MYCDYQALADYATTLNKNFSTIMKSITGIESSFKNLRNTNNWDTQTQYAMETYFKNMEKNFDIIINKFNNVNKYVDSVINNYQMTEKQMENIFGGM